MCTKLNFDVSKVLDHVHKVTLSLDNVKHAPLSGRDFLLTTTLGHTHAFHLTQLQLLELQAGSKVIVQSTDNAVSEPTKEIVAKHHHSIEVTCVKTKFYQQVWFWILIVILIVALLILANQKKAKKTFTDLKSSVSQKYDNFRNKTRRDFSQL